jgi:hypothetical protein
MLPQPLAILFWFIVALEPAAITVLMSTRIPSFSLNLNLDCGNTSIWFG